MIITIDGKQCECEKGEFLLQVAKRNDIYIPTLCHHESLPGQAACRVCLVEVIDNGMHNVVASCVFPIDHEIEVLTDSERVHSERGMVLALLKLRAPESPEIENMCKFYDAPDLGKRLSVSIPGGKCIMCGLCARACKELSVGAISTVNRGVTKEIATPYYEPSDVCVGCKSCASVCPTGAIEYTEDDTTRTIWNKKFELIRCEKCGAVIGTKEEIAEAAKRAGHDPETLCQKCRQEKIADTFAFTYGIIEAQLLKAVVMADCNSYTI